MDWLLSSPSQYGTQPATAPATSPVALENKPGGENTQAVGAMSPQERMRALEQKYGLPEGLLDKVWKRESNRGDPRFMISAAGAKGHFGFMDKTAAAYGVTDPNNFDQAAEGSAKMWRDLLKQYNGDVRLAAAGYNWGSGNMGKYGLGATPKETRDYQDYMAGPTIHQTNNINVTGVSDPAKAAHEIQKAQQISNADMQRQFQPRSR